MAGNGRVAATLAVAVWGTRHTELFTQVILPSWLAPGNIPALASRFNLEFILMSARTDWVRLRASPSVGHLEHLVPVRYVDIDDLVAPGAYAVTLSLAFARAVSLYDEAAAGRIFFFLNGDFVLSNGALEKAGQVIASGVDIVYAPSLRANAHAVLPRLAARHGNIVESYEARSLVRLSLAHLHPTVLSCLADQNLLYSIHPNGFYWRVDGDTLVGRSFLHFPLAVRAKKSASVARCYCDYGFLEMLAPEGAWVVLRDSDDFFALEVAPAGQEQHFLRLGSPQLGFLAASLSEWVTAWQRRRAGIDLIFHANEIPSTARDVQQRAADHIQALQDRLGAPADVDHHPYWVLGVRAWRARRRAAGLSQFPPELAAEATTTLPVGALGSVAGLGEKLLRGRPGHRRRWHAAWSLQRVLQRTLRAGAGTYLLLGDGPVAAEAHALLAPRAIALPAAEEALASLGGDLAAAVLDATGVMSDDVAPLLAAIRRHLAPDAPIFVGITSDRGDERDIVSTALAVLSAAMDENPVSTRRAGHPLEQRLVRAIHLLGQALAGRRLLSVLWYAAGSLIAAISLGLMNAFFETTSNSSATTSLFLVRLEPRSMPLAGTEEEVHVERGDSA